MGRKTAHSMIIAVLLYMVTSINDIRQISAAESCDCVSCGLHRARRNAHKKVHDRLGINAKQYNTYGKHKQRQ